MDHAQKAVAQLVERVRQYAQERMSNVTRGAETPRLSALMLQKYGLGVAEAVTIIFDDNRVADPIRAATDHEVSKIDPDWSKHARERWAGRPADVSHS